MKKLDKESLLNSLSRLIRYRLFVPILRSSHPASYTARGTAIGLLIAMMPTVGVQMPIVLVLWWLIHQLKPAWNFNLIVALAWTWVTNVLTVPFVYYAFLVTGKLLLGETLVHDFSSFTNRLEASLPAEAGVMETIWSYTETLFQRFGLPLFVGCIPWALGSAALGYWGTLKLLLRRKRHQSRKQPDQERG